MENNTTQWIEAANSAYGKGIRSMNWPVKFQEIMKAFTGEQYAEFLTNDKVKQFYEQNDLDTTQSKEEFMEDENEVLQELLQDFKKGGDLIKHMRGEIPDQNFDSDKFQIKYEDFL